MRIKYSTKRKAMQAILDKGFESIGRGQFTKGNMLAWPVKACGGRYMICTTYNFSRR